MGSAIHRGLSTRQLRFRPEKPKFTLDDRLEALTQSVDLLTRDVEAMRERMEAPDRRERKARQAILTGIAAYLRALDANGDEPQNRT